eukprot:Skav228215  [mRNA]  locus=scaffold43:96399:96908:- [translate_table: standard]
MDSTMVITTPVPTAPTSLKLSTSASKSILRLWTFRPMSAASFSREALVTESKTDWESGVTYSPDLVMATKLEVLNSST